MTGPPPRIVIADAAVLVNFLRINRTALLGRLSRSIVITDHVSDEITDHYPEQCARLKAALIDGDISKTGQGSDAELAIFGDLMRDGRLGTGECAAIARAIAEGYALAIDDQKASRGARRIEATLEILGTADLVVMMLHQQLLSVAEADAIKFKWETLHRFGKYGPRT